MRFRRKDWQFAVRRSRRIRSFLKTFDLNNKSLSEIEKGPRARSNYCRAMNTYSRIVFLPLSLVLFLLFFVSFTSPFSSSLRYYSLCFRRPTAISASFLFSLLLVPPFMPRRLFPQFSLGQYMSFTLRAAHIGGEMVSHVIALGVYQASFSS